MSGCLGDKKKNRPYVSGECQTIELALKEWQLHIETYHEKDLKKRLKCEVPNCAFETEYLPNDSAMERIKLHTSISHQPKVEVVTDDEAATPSRESKAMYKAVKCNVVYKKDQTFESFERELNIWIEATKGIAEHAKNLMFVEMLNTTENDDVKRFYVNNVMNHEEIPKTIKEMMKKLRL